MGDASDAIRSGFSNLAVGGRGGGMRGGGQMPLAFNEDYLRTRPEHVKHCKAGSDGTVVKLRANYAQVALTGVNSPNSTIVYQYHVTFEPIVDSKALRALLLKQCALSDYIFDGMIMFIPRPVHTPIAEGQGDVAAVVLTATTPAPEQQPITITVKLTKELCMDDPQCNTVINLVNRRTMESLGYKQFGRHYFDHTRSRRIEKHGLDIWPGFVSAIRLHEEQLLMCLDVSHKVLRLETALNVINRLRDRNLIEKEILGETVMTRYNNRTYRIDEICWDRKPTDSYDLGGEMLTLIQYYKTRHDSHISEPAQPLLLSRRKPRQDSPDEAAQDIYLVPELCSMTGLTDRMRADRNVMREMADWARMTPDKRVATSTLHLQSLAGEAASNDMAVWGLQAASELVAVRGRVLPEETLLFVRNQTARVDLVKADWSRDAKNKGAISPEPLVKWALVFPKNVQTEVERFYNVMQGVGNKLGVNVSMPMVVGLAVDHTPVYLDALSHAIDEGATFVLAVVPSDNEARYNAIKKLCCIDKPVPSQVVLLSTIRKTNILESVVSKVLHQINCKIGGAPWSIDNPLRGHILYKISKIMVVGYDSYRDSSSRGKMVGAAVFSMDMRLTKWFSQSAKFANLNDEQQSANIATFFKNALKNYAVSNDGEYPARIFLFRDGVGEGQIHVVVENEVKVITAAIEQVAGKNSSLTFIVVNKRVNTRFFRETAPNKYDNPQPGTVVDTVVTKPERYDFFMVPQAVNQGTVTPVSYNVIYDANEMPPDRIQRFCYKMCHIYYNWQGTIRIPAPCMYAYKLAFLVAQSLQQPASHQLDNQLYYL